jgi:hypothetical protein
MKKKYSALFIRKDSAYKKREAWDCFDADRDALTFTGGTPVVCHPPCRAWGVMAHMAFRTKDWTADASRDAEREAEKQLAVLSIEIVRANGGILEHPAGSKLFKSHLPDAGCAPDEDGGYTIEIDQYDFGHVAHKMTKLYICGVSRANLPPLPPQCTDIPLRSVAGNVAGTKRCTQYQREYTPELLIDWFEAVLISCI